MFETHFIYSAARERERGKKNFCDHVFFLHSPDRLIRFSLKMYYKWNLIVGATCDGDWFKTRNFALFLTFSFLIIIIVTPLTASIVIGSWKQMKKYNPNRDDLLAVSIMRSCIVLSFNTTPQGFYSLTKNIHDLSWYGTQIG